jgi:hypothetical protein
MRSDVTYVGATHRFLRIRETGGTIFLDYSADRSSWTNYTSVARATISSVDFSGNLSVQFDGGDSAGTVGAMIISEINTARPMGFAGDWKMLFNDDFVRPDVDTTKWRKNWFGANNTVVTVPANSSSEDALDPKCATIEDGWLLLKAIADPVNVSGTDYSYRSGMVNTESLQTFVPTSGKPVVFEAMIDIEASSGTTIGNWPAFWSNGVSWPTNGEIDIAEGLGGDIEPHFHYPAGDVSVNGPAEDNTGIAAWAVKWTYQDKLEFAKDGAVYGTITPRGSGYQTALSSPHYLLCNLAVASAIGGPNHIPGVVRFDYVRAWILR